MPRAVCSHCKSRFFTDEDEDFGVDYCSYCRVKVVKCKICMNMAIMKRVVHLDKDICDECKMKYSTFPNIYLILRFKTFERDNFTCRYCGRSPISDASTLLHCDHIVPRAKGGQDELDNLTTSCDACNMGKMDIMLNDYIINQVKNRGSYGTHQEIEKTGNDQVQDS